MTYVYTEEAVTEALEAIIAEAGEGFVYGAERRERVPEGAMISCYYAQDGKPSCIVGQVIAKLDPGAFATIADWERLAGSVPVSDLFAENSWLDPAGYEAFQPLVAENATLTFALQRLQNRQDAGATWGDAFAEYKSVLADRRD